MATQHSNISEFRSRYKFNGKELDRESGYYYYGARYYDPQVSTWISVDPLAEKYMGFSPYNYTLDNPVMLVDPDGKIIVFPKGTPFSFKIAYAKALVYLYQHNAGDMITKLSQSSKTYYIAYNKRNNHFDPKTNTIYWDPEAGVLTNELISLSPASGLNHEIDHALQYDQHRKQFINDVNTKDTHYTNKEEKRVITGSEQDTALKLGEINKGEVTRKDHKGKYYKTVSPISTEGVNDLTIKANANKSNHKQ